MRLQGAIIPAAAVLRGDRLLVAEGVYLEVRGVLATTVFGRGVTILVLEGGGRRSYPDMSRVIVEREWPD